MTRVVIAAVALVWGTGIAAGSVALWTQSGEPGETRPAALDWPRESRLEPPRGRTLIVFAHPRCPCTRATLREVATIMGRSESRLDARVVFYVPTQAPAQWARGESLLAAARTDGLGIRFDEGGEEARRFGAATSGDTFVFDRDGHLEFRGGLTSGRGHEGDSDGLAAVLALTSGETPGVRMTPVFGCALFSR